MNSRIYEYLLAIEEEQNMTRAAARCLVSQPALSQQVRVYEERLGFPIFDRSASAMIPTEKGQIVLETARQIARIEQELQGTLDAMRQMALQDVRIYIDYTMRNVFLRKIWPKVLVSYPKARLTLTSGDSENAWQFLQNGTADLLILNTRETPPYACIQQTFHEESYLLMASGARYKEADLVERMRNKGPWRHDRVYAKENYSLFPSPQEQAMEQIGLQNCPRIMRAATFQETARQCDEAGGLSLLPESLLHIVKTDLRPIALPEPFHVKGLLVWREEQSLNPLYPRIASVLEEMYQTLQDT